jgi:hypothetical protein
MKNGEFCMKSKKHLWCLANGISLLLLLLICFLWHHAHSNYSNNTSQLINKTVLSVNSNYLNISNSFNVLNC